MEERETIRCRRYRHVNVDTDTVVALPASSQPRVPVSAWG